MPTRQLARWVFSLHKTWPGRQNNPICYLVCFLKSVTRSMTILSASTGYVNSSICPFLSKPNYFPLSDSTSLYIFFLAMQRPQKMLNKNWHLYPNSTSSRLPLTASKSISSRKSNLQVVSPLWRDETNGRVQRKKCMEILSKKTNVARGSFQKPICSNEQICGHDPLFIIYVRLIFITWIENNTPVQHQLYDFRQHSLANCARPIPICQCSVVCPVTGSVVFGTV